MKVWYIISGLFLHFGIINAQSVSCQDKVYIGLCKKGVLIHSLKDTILVSIDNEFYAKVYLTSCTGDLYIQKRRIADSSIIVSGFYKADGKLYKRNVITPDWKKDPSGVATILVTNYYYRPVRTGIWKFYNKRGELYKITMYHSFTKLSFPLSVGVLTNR